MSKNLVYLTFNDAPTGIYNSQVVDVAKHLEEHHGLKVKIIAFVPLKLFKEQRAAFRKLHPPIQVLPAFPGLKNYKLSSLILRMARLFHGSTPVIARNPFAAGIALKLKGGKFSKIIYDARGAIASEFEEYITKDIHLTKLAKEAEQEAVTSNNGMLCVTQKLLEHHQQVYGYSGNKHVIIPTTLDSSFHNPLPIVQQIKRWRIKHDFAEDDIIIVFSGGAADWQSFELIDEFFLKHLDQNNRIKVLLLTKADTSNWKSFGKYRNRFLQTFLSHEQMFTALSACDYGLLLREPSITNSVASPTKCAEYLACGLPVIISEHLGDYSNEVLQFNLGKIYKNESIVLEKPDVEEKFRLALFAKENYFKTAKRIDNNYKTLLSFINY